MKLRNGQRCQDDPSRHQESNHVQEQVEFHHVSKALLKEPNKYKIIGFVFPFHPRSGLWRNPLGMVLIFKIVCLE